MTVDLNNIAKLREITGAGMMDCKKALEEANGDEKKAIEYLRKKGAAIASKRAERDASQGVIVSYAHNNWIGAILELNCETDFVAKNEKFKELANEIVMQVAATNPLYITPEEIPAEVIDKEREIELAKLKAEGKENEVIEKILTGKIDKYYGQVCLLKQSYIKDEKITIEDLINEKTAAIGEKIVVKRFARFELGN